MTSPQPGAQHLHAYARVSTDSQDLRRQQVGLMHAGYPPPLLEKRGGDVERPVLRGLITALEPGSRLGVLHVDRFARDIRQGLDLADLISQQGAELHFVQAGLVLLPGQSSSSVQLVFEMLLVMAGHELRLIRERVTQARAAGRTGGRPRTLSPEQVKQLAIWHDEGWSGTQIGRMLGCSKSTAVREVNRLVLGRSSDTVLSQVAHTGS